MEACMKQDIKRRHGYTKTKELFAFDYGLVELQSALLVVARPLLAALTEFDDLHGRTQSESEDVDLDAIKDLLEDTIVLLGNAHLRLNTWRQKRFSEFLTEVGKRTLKESQRTSTYSQISSILRLRVNMTIVLQTTNLFAHPPQSIFSRTLQEGPALSSKLPSHR